MKERKQSRVVGFNQTLQRISRQLNIQRCCRCYQINCSVFYQRTNASCLAVGAKSC